MGMTERPFVCRPEMGSTEALAGILRDAGFNKIQTQTFLRCLAQKDQKGQCALLEQQRDRLLARLHRAERCIDCLDFLAYQLQRGQMQRR